MQEEEKKAIKPGFSFDPWAIFMHFEKVYPTTYYKPS